MKEFWKNLKKWQRVGIVFGFLAIIIAVVIAIVVIINSEPKVKINFENETGIPGGEIRKIRENLVGVIRENTDDFDESIVYVGNARDYSELPGNIYTTAVFVVDFDEIKESYSVMVTWPDPDDGSPNIVISCPLLNSKYPDTPCVTESNSSKEITGFLPYEGVDTNGDKYKITIGYFASEPYLEVATDGDIQAAVDAAKKWVILFNFDPDDYLFYVRSGNYIQVNHARTKDAKVNDNLPYFIPGAYYVYPVVDENNNVTSLNAELSGCTEYQTDSAESGIEYYLNSKGIDYPINYEYCVN